MCAVFYLLGDKIGLFATNSLNVVVDFNVTASIMEVILVGVAYIIIRGRK